MYEVWNVHNITRNHRYKVHDTLHAVKCRITLTYGASDHVRICNLLGIAWVKKGKRWLHDRSIDA